MSLEEIKEKITDRGANALAMYKLGGTDWYLSEWLNDVRLLEELFDMDYETAFDRVWARKDEQDKKVEERIYKEVCKA